MIILFPKGSKNKEQLKILLKKLLDVLYGNENDIKKDITNVVLSKKYNNNFDFTGGSLQPGSVGNGIVGIKV